MKVLLLGATGKTGRALTERILKDIPDAELTLLARSADRLKINDERVQIISGDATDRSVLSDAAKGQDVVYSVISGYQLPEITKNMISVMEEQQVDRLIFTGAVGIYNEIPASIGGADYNVDNEAPQIPNRKAADLIEASNLKYTILRPGFLRDGSEDDYVLTRKGEPAKGYVTTLPSVVKFGVELLKNPEQYICESISVTRDMTK